MGRRERTRAQWNELPPHSCRWHPPPTPTPTPRRPRLFAVGSASASAMLARTEDTLRRRLSSASAAASAREHPTSGSCGLALIRQQSKKSPCTHNVTFGCHENRTTSFWVTSGCMCPAARTLRLQPRTLIMLLVPIIVRPRHLQVREEEDIVRRLAQSRGLLCMRDGA